MDELRDLMADRKKEVEKVEKKGMRMKKTDLLDWGLSEA